VFLHKFAIKSGFGQNTRRHHSLVVSNLKGDVNDVRLASLNGIYHFRCVHEDGAVYVLGSVNRVRAMLWHDRARGQWVISRDLTSGPLVTARDEPFGSNYLATPDSPCRSRSLARERSNRRGRRSFNVMEKLKLSQCVPETESTISQERLLRLGDSLSLPDDICYVADGKENFVEDYTPLRLPPTSGWTPSCTVTLEPCPDFRPYVPKSLVELRTLLVCHGIDVTQFGSSAAYHKSLRDLWWETQKQSCAFEVSGGRFLRVISCLRLSAYCTLNNVRYDLHEEKEIRGDGRTIDLFAERKSLMKKLFQNESWADGVARAMALDLRIRRSDSYTIQSHTETITTYESHYPSVMNRCMLHDITVELKLPITSIGDPLSGEQFVIEEESLIGPSWQRLHYWCWVEAHDFQALLEEKKKHHDDERKRRVLAPRQISSSDSTVNQPTATEAELPNLRLSEEADDLEKRNMISIRV